MIYRFFSSFFLGLITFFYFLHIPLVSFAQQPIPEGPDRHINAKTRTEVIKSLFTNLNRLYIFPKVAAQIQTNIQNRLAQGEYDGITSSKEFATLLTTQLYQISRDKHVGIYYQNELVQEDSSTQKPTPEEDAEKQAVERSIHFGLEKIERLTGNVGYLRIDQFVAGDAAAEMITAAMTYLAYTDALLIDLRYNNGGEPSTVNFLASYFFGPDAVHLNDLYGREGKIQQFWTLSYVPGRRYRDKPVYIITSKRTVSAAEEFTYDLQSLKRATVIGETTSGGANPGEFIRIDDHFTAFIPMERTVNPVTQTNWEGTGIKPDVEVAEAQALKTAHLAALEKILRTTRDEQTKSKLSKVISQLKNTN